MRILGTLAAVALVSSSTLAAASADYFLHIKGIGRDAASGPIYLLADIGDLDGDGVSDEATIRLNCAGGALHAVHYNVKSPRDSASGMASGRRTHKPVTFVKEWGASTPQFRAMKVSWDLKEAKGARMPADSEGWVPMSLSGADGLCDAAQAAAGQVNKSKSNVRNN